MELTFSLHVPAGMSLRYAAAVAVLSLRRSRAVWLSILAVIAGAIWWAIADVARNQSGWWVLSAALENWTVSARRVLVNVATRTDLERLAAPRKVLLA